MPDIVFDSLDQIPEGLREDAKQEGAKFKINVVSNKKLNEFRENNITIARERDEVKARWERVAPIVGDDVDKFVSGLTEAQTLAQQVKDGKLKGTEAIEAEVTKRVNERLEGSKVERANVEAKLATVLKSESEWKTKYERSVKDQQITSSVIGKDSVANPEALPDILSRADKVFVVQPDGSLLPKRSDGTTIYGADGVSPMTPHEWLTKLVAEAPYLGKSSAGGGANGGNSNGPPGSKYGMSAEEFQKLPPTTRITLERQAQAGRRT